MAKMSKEERLEAIEKTKQLAAQGFNMKQIAECLGESYETIKYRCWSNEINIQKKQVSVSNNPDKRQKVMQAIALVDQGMSYKEAAHEVGTDTESVYYYIYSKRKQKVDPVTSQAKPCFVCQTFNRLFIEQAITTNPYKLAGV